jgi:hypothetical protein
MVCARHDLIIREGKNESRMSQFFLSPMFSFSKIRHLNLIDRMVEGPVWKARRSYRIQLVASF